MRCDLYCRSVFINNRLGGRRNHGVQTAIVVVDVGSCGALLCQGRQLRCDKNDYEQERRKTAGDSFSHVMFCLSVFLRFKAYGSEEPVCFSPFRSSQQPAQDWTEWRISVMRVR